ncbi:hypothetical protein PENTCL1PPCAC_9610, partial [Pristionchus entomophagus]
DRGDSVKHVVGWNRSVPGHIGPITKDTPTVIVPKLAMSRSLGDFWSYVEETQEFAVFPNPDVSVTVLTPDHYSIVLATDGLTNVLKAEQIASVMDGLRLEEKFPIYFTNPNERPNAARILMRGTMKEWRRSRADNVSVVAVIFADESQPFDMGAPSRLFDMTK